MKINELKWWIKISWKMHLEPRRPSQTPVYIIWGKSVLYSYCTEHLAVRFKEQRDKQFRFHDAVSHVQHNTPTVCEHVCEWAIQDVNSETILPHFVRICLSKLSIGRLWLRLWSGGLIARITAWPMRYSASIVTCSGHAHCEQSNSCRAAPHKNDSFRHWLASLSFEWNFDRINHTAATAWKMKRKKNHRMNDFVFLVVYYNSYYIFITHGAYLIVYTIYFLLHFHYAMCVRSLCGMQRPRKI